MQEELQGFYVGQEVWYENTDFDAVSKWCLCVVNEICSDHMILLEVQTQTKLWIEVGLNLDLVYVTKPRH